MKLIYIANARIPTEKAHGLQIASMCAAFASEGADVTLVVPKRNGSIAEDLFSYYGVQRNFSVQYISSPEVSFAGTFNYWINQLLFTITVCFSRRVVKKEYTIFTRDEWTGYVLRLLGYTVFYDMHGFPEYKRWLWKLSLRSMTGIVGTNQWKLDQAHRLFGIPHERMVLVRNGYDASLFPAHESREKLRHAFGFLNEQPLVLYTGHLYDWKGASVLADAALRLPNVLFVFIGGTKKDCAAFRERFSAQPNIRVLGQKSHQEIPRYLAVADVLVVPNSRHSSQERYKVYSEFDTSPIKVFEYMASGVPILASDLPAIREIIDERSAFFAEPDSTESIVKGIQEVLSNRIAAGERAACAKEMSKKYTLALRAKSILTFITTITMEGEKNI